MNKVVFVFERYLLTSGGGMGDDTAAEKLLRKVYPLAFPTNESSNFKITSELILDKKNQLLQEIKMEYTCEDEYSLHKFISNMRRPAVHIRGFGIKEIREIRDSDKTQKPANHPASQFNNIFKNSNSNALAGQNSNQQPIRNIQETQQSLQSYYKSPSHQKFADKLKHFGLKFKPYGYSKQERELGHNGEVCHIPHKSWFPNF